MNGHGSTSEKGAVSQPAFWQSSERFCILDTAFHQGADFLRLRRLWEAAPGKCARLHYIALCGEEPSPPPAELREIWPLHLPGHHQVQLDGGSLRLTLVFGEAASELRRLVAVCDLVLLKEPTAQTAPLARLSSHGTVIQCPFQDPETFRALEASGFLMDVAAAHIRGVYRVRGKRARLCNPYPGERHAIVVGAGLAGSAIAGSLSRRGWRVTVLEKRIQPARAASGNLAGVISPMISKDDGLAARLSRASFLSLLAELQQFESEKVPLRWAACGVLQMGRDEKEEALLREILLKQGYPSEFARFMTKDEASRHVGHAVPAGGVFFPGGGWVNPPSLCAARLQAPNIALQNETAVWRFEREEEGWRVYGQEGQRLAEAPVLILANAFEGSFFAQTKPLHFKKVRGQVTHIPVAALPPVGCVLSRDGYLAPALDGEYSLGATYDFGSQEESLNADCQRLNLGRLPGLLQGAGIELSALSGRVGFRSLTADRLPVVGAVPDFGRATAPSVTLENVDRYPGLYALLGLGSRGIVWSALAGDTLASLIEGEAPPLPLDLLEAIDPERFLLRERSLSTARGPG